MATDKRHEIIEQLYEKAHRFLHEDEVIDATVNADLSIIDANYIINSLLEKGVYISENIKTALSEQKKEAKTAVPRTIGERKSPEDPTTFKMLNIPKGSKLTFLKDIHVIAITVDDVNQIELQDGSLKGSLSNVAQILAVRYGYADTSRQGTRWWLYNGEKLFSLRERLDKLR